MEIISEIFISIIITGDAISYSTTIFMTITNNRILTPSVMGLDSLYLLIQVFIIFSFGSKSLVMMSSNINFLITVGIMGLFSLVLFRLLFKGEGNNIRSEERRVGREEKNRGRQ